ncbi:G-box-binding factor 3-like isoform X1 [Telopea speciosissima]|uniref:G-box-binding factor 3-like isoform X1 n=1 Tax=Telopea speciosissima TaxID=54955 RepID=UPI001CC566CF|nr:G-box-binding factor 3-like isoform X1 [Telopea speciosissima]XP_043687328.1 G-box-binding factor 3-like isoform X1 [Telopea speciosissima]
MGNNKTVTPKSEKASSPGQEQTNVHAYTDWANIQAYYGPGVIPPPYFNSAVASGHAPPPYMWGHPQPLMPPYGAPYAIYSHGGVYAHPAVPYGSHGHGIPPSPVLSEFMVATPLSVEPPAKSSTSKDRGLMKKLKGFDGLAVSIGNGKAENAVTGSAHGMSQSEECGTEGSSDGSDGNTGGDKSNRKRNSEGSPSTGKDGKLDPVPVGEANVTPGVVVPACDALPSELWVQDERELKRERRKQSNRESARRSRLRKQAETEELALKVETMSAENIALRSELNRLMENSEKLRLENAVLMEKLKNAQLEEEGEMAPNNMESETAPHDSTENLLSRVNNSSSVTSEQEDSEPNENSNSSTKLHQLLETSPRADAVAAG